MSAVLVALAWIAAALAVSGSGGGIRSAGWLVVVLAAVAIAQLGLGAIGLAWLTFGLGVVSTGLLFAFSAWAIGADRSDREASDTVGWRVAGVLFAAVLATFAWAFAPGASDPDPGAAGFVSVATLGRLLTGDALVVLESLGVLLLVAIVGVTLLAVPGPRA